MDEETFKKQVSEFMADIYRKAAELGGLISGEHGIGLWKERLSCRVRRSGEHAPDARHQGDLRPEDDLKPG